MKKLFILTFSLIITASPVMAKEKAGIVILSKGNFFAVGTDNKKRKLRRRSPIYPGDTLETGENSLSQVRFVDNAIISLHPNTSLRIDEYTLASTSSDQKDSGVISLLKGGFRTITGKIKQKDYKVNTEVASIGIRGTEYEIALGNGLNIAAWSGAITISNNSGSMSLGQGHPYNFASIQGQGLKPTGLLQPPKILTRENARVLTQRKAQTFRKVQVKKRAPKIVQNKKTVFNFIQNKVAVVQPPLNSIENTEQVQSSSGSTKDLSSVTLNRLGLLVIAGANRPNFYGGKASSNDAGSPVITDNGYGPHEPEFLNAAPDFAFWRNNATLVIENKKTLTNNSSSIYYGKWTGTATDKPIMQVDPLGSAAEYEIPESVYYITARPTAPSVIAGRTGTYNYDQIDLVGNINGTAISSFNVNIVVDFSTGNIQSGASLDFTAASIVWDLNLTGSIKSNILDAQISSATINSTPTPLKGEIPMVFTGNNGNGIAGAFNLEEDGNPSNHAEGVFVLDFSGG